MAETDSGSMGLHFVCNEHHVFMHGCGLNCELDLPSPTCSRAPSNVSTVIHILYLPEEAKGESVQFQWKQDSLRVGEVYEACWALDNILVINSAHREVVLEDNLDPVDTGNWLFFPGATVKVGTFHPLFL